MGPSKNTTHEDDQRVTIDIWSSLFSVLADLWRLPNCWKTCLKKISVPELIDGIEKEAASFPNIVTPQVIIGTLVRIRTVMTIQWRRNRCLLKGLLLIYFFAKAGRPATFHLSCHLMETGNITGHCWVSQPKGKKEGSIKLKNGWVEIYTHRIASPPKKDTIS